MGVTANPKSKFCTTRTFSTCAFHTRRYSIKFTHLLSLFLGTIIDVRGQSESNEAWTPTIKNIVSSVLRASGSNLRYYVGLRINGDVQIVLVSRDGDPSESLTAARAISNKLKQGAKIDENSIGR